MTQANEVKKYYPSEYLAGDGSTLTQEAVAAGSTDQEFISTGLNEVDDYWVGALIFFDFDTDTVALQGQFGQIIDSVQSTTTVKSAYPFPATPSTSDTFRLVKGAKWRSSYRIPGKTVDSGPLNVTGVTIDFTSEKNADGSGTLTYTNTGQTLTWQDSEDSNPGIAVAVGAGGAFAIYSESNGKWLEVTVSAGSLSGSDQSDTIVLSTKEQIRLPDAIGAQTFAGATRYFAEIHKNESSMSALSYGFYIQAPTDTSTTLVDALGLGASTVEVADGSFMPSSSFWLYNEDKDDIRFVDFRSGNDVTTFASGSGDVRRGFTALSWDIGNTITVFPNIDIAYEDPTGTEFTDDLSTLTYSAPTTFFNSIRQTTLAVDGLTMLAWREVIPEGSRARSLVKDNVNYCWE